MSKSNLRLSIVELPLNNTAIRTGSSCDTALGVRARVVELPLNNTAVRTGFSCNTAPGV